MLGITDKEKKDIANKFVETQWEYSFDVVDEPLLVGRNEVADSLKESISSVYTDGVDEIIGIPKLRRDAIGGYFRAGREFFQFHIDTNSGNITYYEVNAHTDSYISGYYLGDIAPYLPPKNLQKMMLAKICRFDAASKKRCQVGIPCGATCVAKGSKCSMSLGVKQKQQVMQVRQALLSSDATRAALLAGGLAGGAIALGALGGAATVAGFENRRRAAEDRRTAESERIRASEELEEAAQLRREALALRKPPPTTPAKKARKVAGAALRAAVPAAIAASTTGNPIAAGAVASAAGIAAGVAAAKEVTNIGADYIESGELPKPRRTRKRSGTNAK
jgi:hypothetical protein